jgi:hypothetical protein
MWETLDFRDHRLVVLAQREWRQQAARDRLARELRTPRRSMIGALAARMARSKDSTDLAA